MDTWKQEPNHSHEGATEGDDFQGPGGEAVLKPKEV